MNWLQSLLIWLNKLFNQNTAQPYCLCSSKSPISGGYKLIQASLYDFQFQQINMWKHAPPVLYNRVLSLWIRKERRILVFSFSLASTWLVWIRNQNKSQGDRQNKESHKIDQAARPRWVYKTPEMMLIMTTINFNRRLNAAPKLTMFKEAVLLLGTGSTLCQAWIMLRTWLSQCCISSTTGTSCHDKCIPTGKNNSNLVRKTLNKSEQTLSLTKEFLCHN